MNYYLVGSAVGLQKRAMTKQALVKQLLKMPAFRRALEAAGRKPTGRMIERLAQLPAHMGIPEIPHRSLMRRTGGKIEKLHQAFLDALHKQAPKRALLPGNIDFPYGALHSSAGKGRAAKRMAQTGMQMRGGEKYLEQVRGWPSKEKEVADVLRSAFKNDILPSGEVFVHSPTVGAGMTTALESPSRLLGGLKKRIGAVGDQRAALRLEREAAKVPKGLWQRLFG